MPFLRLRLPALIIAVAFALVTIGSWAWFNRPEAEPEWPAKVWGFALSPYQADQNAIKEEYPTREQIASDLDVLKGKTQAIRTYTVAGTIGLVPELAAARGLNVALGVWIDARRERNEQELAKAVEIARTHRNVVRVIIGNESVLRGDLPFADFLNLLDRARAQIQQPVSTAEPWHVWLRTPSSPTMSTTWRCTCCRTGRGSRSMRRSSTRSTSSTSCRRPSRTSRS